MTELTRREILSTSVAAALAGLTTSASVAAKGPSRRPNILWLVSEDNNPFIGAYGDKLAHTPTLDRLARQGILYRNAYSNAPVCAPSRFAILTGVLPESAGPAHHMRAIARLPSLLGGFPEYLRSAGYYCTNNTKTDYNADLKPDDIWDQSDRNAHWKNRPKDSPFFAVFNHEITHETSLFAPTQGRIRPQDVRIPAYLPDTPGIRGDFANYYNRMEQLDTAIGAQLAELDAAGLAEDTIVFYYSDNGGVLPRSKRHCFDEGLRCALIVRLPASWQHLAPAVAGSQIDAPVTFIDLAPTVLSLAGIPKPAYMQGSAFLGTQIEQPKRYAFGMRNRMDERYDMVRTVTDGRYRYIRNYAPHRIWGQQNAFAWLAKGYQDWEAAHLAGTLDAAQDAFWRTKPFELFFDLQADPDQVRNLISTREQAKRINAMRKALDRHMLSINDNGFIPEGSPIEGYLESRRAGDYPLRKILALAAIAAQGKAENIEYLAGHLNDPNEVMRYWAAQGLLILGEGARPALAALERRLDEEESPHVLIAIAETLANQTSAAAPVELLIELLDRHAHPRVRLQAINALTFIGERARPARGAAARAAASDDEYLMNAGRYLGFVLDGTYTPASPVFDFKAMMERMAAQPRPGG